MGAGVLGFPYAYRMTGLFTGMILTFVRIKNKKVFGSNWSINASHIR
jgi:hypothetical protein